MLFVAVFLICVYLCTHIVLTCVCICVSVSFKTNSPTARTENSVKIVYTSERVKQCNLVHYYLEASWGLLESFSTQRKCNLYRGELEVSFSKVWNILPASSYKDEKLSDQGVNWNRKICGSMSEFYTTYIAFQMTSALECNSAFGLCECLGLSGLPVMWHCSLGHRPNS